MTFKYFSLSEFACKHTGINLIEEEFVAKLDELRERCGFPFKITSGYRAPTHPAEAKKEKPGYHSHGIAADIACNSEQAYVIIREATDMGFGGIYRGAGFVHVDDRTGPKLFWKAN